MNTEKKVVYLDNSATTKVYPEVREMMLKVMDEDFGNPSSLHTLGYDAEQYIKNAAKSVAAPLKAKPEEIVFTSGGTESNNMAIIGTAMAHKRRGMHIISTTIEHSSVMNTLHFLEKQGFEITLIGTDSNGKVDAEEVAAAVREDTILVTIMHVNNEIGSIQPVEQIGKLIKRKNPNVIFHVDAIQSFGKIPVVPKKIGADLLSISGHKIHGPKGSGALYVKGISTRMDDSGKKDKILIRPIIYGGGQQGNYRSGTENVPAIAGLGVACDKTFENFEEKIKHITELKEALIEKMTSFPEVYSNSQDAPHIVSISFTGTRSAVMLNALSDKGIYVSAGSACSSNDNNKKISGVLKAIDLPKDRLESTLRFSFGEDNTMEEVEYVYDVVSELLPFQRKYVRK